uniref:Uncharacterized protein n=1 Tax=Arundo donax TaxID=35708 RepID=A0A0A9EIV4_ARUDO
MNDTNSMAPSVWKLPLNDLFGSYY